MDAVNRSNADVLSFSPFLDQSSLYLNPFEQGNEHHPGLLDNAQKVVERLGLDVKLSQLVCDHTTTIFCNYFVARYEVWKTWLALGEQLFAICEDPNDALGVVLSRSTTYRNEATTPMKVFLAERLITLVLEKSGLCARPCLDLEIAPLGIPGAGALMGGLLICDALKGQFRKTGQKIFMDNYQYHRREICNRLANNNGRQP